MRWVLKRSLHGEKFTPVKYSGYESIVFRKKIIA